MPGFPGSTASHRWHRLVTCLVKETRDALGVLLADGHALQARVSTEDATPTQADLDAWAQRVHDEVTARMGATDAAPR